MVDISPSHDAFAHSGEPTLTHDTNPLQAGGNGSPGLITFLQFAIPSGTYSAASLRLRVSAGAGDNSSTTFYIYEADATFDEATLTWNNKPTLDTGTTLWSGAPFTALSTTHDLTLDESVVNANAGGNLVIGITSNDVSDIVRWHSDEDAVEAYRPLLTLTQVADNATFDLTITHTTDSAAVADRTYEIDATASVGTVTLTQTSGTTVSDTESPTGVFTFADPGGTDDLVFDLDAGTDTAVVTIPRATATAPAVRHLIAGGTPTDDADWV